MKTSIVIISYNEKDYLRNAFNSCLEQGLDDFEVVIADDGSTDGSIEIIKELHASYPSVVKFYIEDRGHIDFLIPSIRCSNLLKKAFKMCEGDFIEAMSADDIFYDKNKTKKQLSFLMKHPKYMSCYCDFNKYYEDTEVTTRSLNPRFVSRKMLWARYYVHVSCFLFRRQCLNNLLNNFCDDTGLLYSLLISGKCKHLPFIGFQYKQRQNSIMSSSSEMKLNILEVLLIQDLLNFKSKQYLNSTKCRLYKPLEYCFNNADQIENKEKYLQLFEDNSLLKAVFYKDESALKIIRDYKAKRRANSFPYFCSRMLNKVAKLFRGRK